MALPPSSVEYSVENSLLHQAGLLISIMDYRLSKVKEYLFFFQGFPRNPKNVHLKAVFKRVFSTLSIFRADASGYTSAPVAFLKDF
jgi:hypothetical protein